jgi:PAS domain S-box-containing protein
MLVGGMSFIIVAGMGWVASLRRQVRKQTELIRKEKTLLATLIDHLPDNVYVKDLEGRFVLTNLAHARFHGAPTPQFFQGKSSSDLLPPEFASRYAEADQQVLSGKTTNFATEEPARNSEGKPRCLSTLKVPLKDHGGRIIGLVGISRDITERKAAEEALQNSERFMRSLVESLPQNVLRKDAEGRFTFANDLFCRTLGKSMDQIIGKTDFDLFPDELAKKYRQDDLQVMANGQPLEMVEQNRDSDGQPILVQVIKTPLRDAENRVIGLQIVFWDVTERQRAEEALRNSEEEKKTILSVIQAGIIILDAKTHEILDVNDAALKLIGRTKGFLLGQRCHKVLCPTEQGKCPVTQLGGAIQNSERVLLDAQGNPIPILKSVVPLVLHGRQCLLECFLDLRERKRTEDELRKAQSDLLHTSRLAGMAEVATSVLHNVGNVLNSVNVSAGLISARLKQSKLNNLGRATALMAEHASDLGAFLTTDPRGRQLPGYLGQLAEHLSQEQRAILEEIESLTKNVEHVKDIVATQQSYAKVAGVTELVSVTDLVEDALRMNAGALLRHDVQIERQYQPDVPDIMVEKHKVLQVLVNLIRNAKYACDESTHPEKRLTMRVDSVPGRVRISTIDNGVGIPRENLTRIFNHGFTTRKDGHGFGLHSGALAAKEMGGELTAASDGAGKGATFCLELPLAPTRAK